MDLVSLRPGEMWGRACSSPEGHSSSPMQHDKLSPSPPPRPTSTPRPTRLQRPHPHPAPASSTPKGKKYAQAQLQSSVQSNIDFAKPDGKGRAHGKLSGCVGAAQGMVVCEGGCVFSGCIPAWFSTRLTQADCNQAARFQLLNQEKKNKTHTTQPGRCLQEQGANLHEKAEEPPSATAQASQGGTPAFPLPSERWWLELEADRRYRPSATRLGDRPGSVGEGPRAAPRPAQLWKTGGRRLGCVRARPPLAM